MLGGVVLGTPVKGANFVSQIKRARTTQKGRSTFAVSGAHFMNATAAAGGC